MMELSVIRYYLPTRQVLTEADMKLSNCNLSVECQTWSFKRTVDEVIDQRSIQSGMMTID